MSYTFVKITTYYRDYVKQYYDKNPQLAELSYGQQYSHLMSQAYGWSDFYSKHLRNLGVDAQEIVANAELLQNTWAKEKGLNVTGKDIVFEQIKALQPDVVFFQDSFVFNGEWVSNLRKNIPSIKKIYGWCCAPFTPSHLDAFQIFDTMFVCSEIFQQAFETKGMKSHIIHHAFESTLLPQLPENNQYPQTDFIFLGSIINGKGFHDERKRLLTRLIDEGIDCSLYMNIQEISSKDLFLRRSAYLAVKALQQLGMRKLSENIPVIKKALALQEYPSAIKDIDKIKKNTRPPLYGLEMLKALSHASIGFNNHGEIAGDYAANVRMFEVTGVGSCLITDWKSNLHTIFEIDSEIISYKSVEECIEKIIWLMNHSKERKEIALKGQQRVLRDHTYKHRAGELHMIIQNQLGGANEQ